MNPWLRAFIVSLLCLSGLLGCASTAQRGADGAATPDPYEGFNRTMFAFNEGLDTYLLKPATKGYQWITPDFAEKGVSNFFSNLFEIRSLINAGLQGKGRQSLTYTGRFLLNSTLGVFGLFDVASAMGLKKLDGEDFGQTLATWGVGSGAYLVLPFLGPSTLRDGFSLPVDAMADPVNYVDHDRTRYSLMAGRLIDTRASLLSAEQLITGDRYVFLRDVYLQRRDYLINDGELDDDFGDDFADDEDF
ncbi:MAG: VacJ family lipoprotein [Cellvibrionaceae bacterium]|nr:VacJ family lipoprotein [Cellvibrionaceae bacterium]